MLILMLALWYTHPQPQHLEIETGQSRVQNHPQPQEALKKRKTCKQKYQEFVAILGYMRHWREDRSKT